MNFMIIVDGMVDKYSKIDGLLGDLQIKKQYSLYSALYQRSI